DGGVVTGPQASKDNIAVLSRLADRAGVVLHRFLDELGAQFASVDAIVSMGGYNTLVEAVSSGTPTVCVPRVRPSAEQLVRARAFAQRGLLRLLEPAALDAASLAAEVGAALDTPRTMLIDRARTVLRTDGAS